MRKHRVLVIDDSRSMRQLIAHTLSLAGDIEIVGEAADAYEAREAIKTLEPDVVTLDVEMPKMNGLEFLERLMRLRPTRVIMVSAHTGPQKDLTLQALAIGAIGCVAKPQLGDPRPFAGLAEAVRDAAGVTLRSATMRPAVRIERDVEVDYRSDERIVAIGSSAGGIEALSAVLEHCPRLGPPIVITQHMPAAFTKSLAARLDRLCDATIEEAATGSILEPGKIYIAPGGGQHLEIRAGTRFSCTLVPGDPVSGHRPSVDVLFQSVARAAGAKSIGIILSGMGRDGADGLAAMRRAGARTIGQDAATSFIYGMPRIAFETGGVEQQLPLPKIGPTLFAMTNNLRK